MEAGPTLEGGRALVPPSQSPVPGGSPNTELSISPVTVIDEDIAARPQDLQPWRPGDFPRSTPH